jgi:hypothetical protein
VNQTCPNFIQSQKTSDIYSLFALLSISIWNLPRGPFAPVDWAEPWLGPFSFFLFFSSKTTNLQMMWKIIEIEK